MSTKGFNYHRGGPDSLVGNQVCDTLLWSKFSNTSFSSSNYRNKSTPKLDISTDYCCIDFYFFLTVSQFLLNWIHVVKTAPNLSFYLISERMSLPTLDSVFQGQIDLQSTSCDKTSRSHTRDDYSFPFLSHIIQHHLCLTTPFTACLAQTPKQTYFLN